MKSNWKPGPDFPDRIRQIAVIGATVGCSLGGEFLRRAPAMSDQDLERSALKSVSLEFGGKKAKVPVTGRRNMSVGMSVLHKFFGNDVRYSKIGKEGKKAFADLIDRINEVVAAAVAATPLSGIRAEASVAVRKKQMREQQMRENSARAQIRSILLGDGKHISLEELESMWQEAAVQRIMDR